VAKFIASNTVMNELHGCLGFKGVVWRLLICLPTKQMNWAELQTTG
jgi:hypothetical protein